MCEILAVEYLHYITYIYLRVLRASVIWNFINTKVQTFMPHFEEFVKYMYTKSGVAGYVHLDCFPWIMLNQFFVNI